MQLPDFHNNYNIRADVPDLADYFGLWAIHSDYLAGKVSSLQGYNLTAHVAAKHAEPAAEIGFEFPVTQGGTALINVTGPMMKRTSSLSGGTSTLQVRRQLRQAAASDEVGTILLRIDSPGGTVSGTGDLAADVAAANARKPVVAFIEDLGASAAYWVASQAGKIFANPTALVGSIGTYGVLEDLSGMAAQLGVKVHVVRAGSFKGTGVEGTEITHEQLNEAQRVVDELNEHFVKGVAAGRNLNLAVVRTIADGRVHLARSAQEMGLIDGVQSLDKTLEQLSRERKKMTTTKVAATLGELKTACPGASAEFYLEQMEGGATVEEARGDFIASQQLQIESLSKEKAELEKAKAKPAETVSTGVDPLIEQAGKKAVDGTASDEFWGLVKEKEAAGLTHAKAVSAIVAANPELHRQMLADYNASHEPRR